MKKKGYTLIELIVVIAIMIILMGSGFSVISSLNYIKNDVEAENALYEVYNLLSYAKAYCRLNFYEGEIIIDTNKNTIQFVYRDPININKKNIVKTEKFTRNIEIHTNFIKPVIEVSNNGYLKKSGTIFITNGKKQRNITIAVGNDTTNIIDVNEKIDEINR